MQTKGYARAVFRSVRPSIVDEVIERSLQARLTTQSLPTRTPARHLTFVLEESCLRNRIGGEANVA
ncbi:hypothetical protein DXZ75_37910 [Streptomyces sp. AcE210]|nr:hypothetical protein DXZ75_37910 [Streptomyces sp. AcE210]